MAEIKVNSSVMKEKASNFKNVAKSVEQFTNDMMSEIDSLKQAWEGEAAEALVNKFKGLRKNFEDICKTINQYGDFLTQAAENYDKVEESIKQGAEGQKS
jgi:hypothetical protein